jgi:hypothetical protein
MYTSILRIIIPVVLCAPFWVDAAGVLGVTQIAANRTMATADNTFENGWKWTFDVTIPDNETLVSMKFMNWTGSSTVPVANNMRIYSPQATDAFSTSTARMITAENAYPPVFNISSSADLDVLYSGRQIQIVMESKLPIGSTGGSYTTSYGIQTSPDPDHADTTPPVITLVGGPHVEIELGGVFVDPGATAHDSEDGDITHLITASGVINTGVAGTYTLNYNVADSSGNHAASVQRLLTVKQQSEYIVSPSSSNPAAQTVQVSQTADTNDVLLLAMDVKTENGAMVLQKLPVTVATVDGTSDGVAPYTNAIVKSLKLYANGVKIADESVSQDGIDSALETIIFGNTSDLEYALSSNSTVVFEVRADIHDTEDTGQSASDFDNGDAISVSYTDTNLGDTVVLGGVLPIKSGTVVGGSQTLRSTGLQVSMGSSTTEASTNQTGEILNRTIKVPVSITAIGGNMYLSQSAWNESTAIGTKAIAFTFEDAGGLTETITNSATWTSTDATVEGASYRIEEGSTKNFVLTVILAGATGQVQNQYRVQLNQVNGWTDSALTLGQSLQDLSPANSFETPFYTLNKTNV